MLLELLSDFQISIPELGRIEARTHPVVLLTSNNSRELTEALKRRCLYLWLDYPSPEHELEIVRLHAPELPAAVAREARRGRSRRCASSTSRSRRRSRSRSTGRARCCCSAPTTSTRTCSARRCRSSSSTAPTSTSSPSASACGSGSRRGRGVSLAGPDRRASREALRAEGAGGRDVGAARRVRRARARCRGRTAAAFREALAATLAKSPDDRRVFELVFERFFFRAAEEQAVARDVREPTGADGDGMHRRRADRPRQPARAGDRRRSATATRARCATSRGSRSPPSGAAARARACSASTCSGSAARSTCAPSAQPREDGVEPLTRDQIRRFEQQLRRELERAQIERTQAAAAGAAAQRARPRAAVRARCRTSPPSTASSRSSSAGSRRRATRRAAGAAHAHVDVRRTMRASLQTGGVPVVLQVPPAAPAPARALRALRRLDQRHERVGVLPLGAARAARLVPQDALVRVRRADLRGHRRLRARAQLQGGVGGDRRATPASPTSPATRTTAASGASSSTLVEDDLHPRATVIVLGDARTNGRDPRADVFARRRRARRAHVLAQPRAAAVLELRRLGRARLRAVLRAARVLDDAPARGLRAGADAPAARLSVSRPRAPARSRARCRRARPGGRARSGPRRRPRRTMRRNVPAGSSAGERLDVRVLAGRELRGHVVEQLALALAAGLAERVAASRLRTAWPKTYSSTSATNSNCCSSVERRCARRPRATARSGACRSGRGAASPSPSASRIHGWRANDRARAAGDLAPAPSRQPAGSSSSGMRSSPMIASPMSVDEVVLGADVVVERHRPGAELGGDPAHRDGLEALGVGDRERRRDDLLAAAGGPPLARLGRDPDGLVSRRVRLDISYSVLLACSYDARISRTAYEIPGGIVAERARQALRRPLGAPRRSTSRSPPARCSACSATTARARRPRSGSSPRSPCPTDRPRAASPASTSSPTRRGARAHRARRARPRPSTACSTRAREPASSSAGSTTCPRAVARAARRRAARAPRPGRRRRPAREDVLGRHAAPARPRRERWSPRRRCCSSTSRRPGSTRRAATTSGSCCASSSRDGTTLLLTTQYLEEADRLADDIVVLDHGRVAAAGLAGGAEGARSAASGST